MKQTQKDFDELIKIILIGEPNVGKSSIINRYAQDTFLQQNQYQNIGIDFQSKMIQKYDKKIKLYVWDSVINHNSCFIQQYQTYYRNMKGALFVYDITDRKSYVQLTQWIDHFMRNKKYARNKCDLELTREVTKDEGKQLADSLGFLFLEVSAKTSQNVNDAFVEFMNQILLKV